MNNNRMLPVIVKLCRTCVHLRMDIRQPNDFTFARCAKFGNQCAVSGEVTYIYAERCRRNFTMCGIEGKHHKTKDELY